MPFGNDRKPGLIIPALAAALLVCPVLLYLTNPLTERLQYYLDHPAVSPWPADVAVHLWLGGGLTFLLMISVGVLLVRGFRRLLGASSTVAADRPALPLLLVFLAMAWFGFFAWVLPSPLTQQYFVHAAGSQGWTMRSIVWVVVNFCLAGVGMLSLLLIIEEVRRRTRDDAGLAAASEDATQGNSANIAWSPMLARAAERFDRALKDLFWTRTLAIGPGRNHGMNSPCPLLPGKSCPPRCARKSRRAFNPSPIRSTPPAPTRWQPVTKPKFIGHWPASRNPSCRPAYN